MPESGPDFMERLSRTSRIHFPESTPSMSGELNVRTRWSMDVAKNAIGGALGTDIKTPEQFKASLAELDSDRLRRFINASTLLTDAELESGSGRQVLLERAAGLRKLTEEEDLSDRDQQVIGRLSKAIGRKISGVKKVGGAIGSSKGEEYLKTIAEGIGKEGPMLKVEKEVSPESWAQAILLALNNLEDRSGNESKKFEDLAFLGELQTIRRTLATFPEALNQTTQRDARLSDLLGREIYLKEKLELILEARRRLHNRKVEVTKAEGDLKQLGVGEKVPLAEGVQLAFTDMRPIDWYILLHQDDLIKRDIRESDLVKRKELVVPVADAMSLWQQIAEIDWNKPLPGQPDKKFGDALNSDEVMKRLRLYIAEKTGKKAEQSAFDIFMITLSFDRWDEKRVKIAGKNDARDLIYFDEKRRQDYYDKLGAAGPEPTIGSYFAKEHQGEVVPKVVKDFDYDKVPRNQLQQERLRVLKKNRERAVFLYSFNDPAKGHLVGDFWESNTAEPGGVKKNLAQIARDSGWKSINFLQFGEGFYSGYFGYALGITDMLVKNFNKMGWDPQRDGLTNPMFWQQMSRNIERITTFSPIFNTKNIGDPPDPTDLEFVIRNINKIKARFAQGVFWDGSQFAEPRRSWVIERNRVTNWITDQVIPQKGRYPESVVRTMLKAIDTSGYLRDQGLGYLMYYIQDYKYPKK